MIHILHLPVKKDMNFVFGNIQSKHVIFLLNGDDKNKKHNIWYMH